ncbi:SDR family oxidoreductase, partial [Candidatus Dojkabacteria bacterium]|nr:SDR family oxidoreductase [Candidatus Dojkabacteria bacterium]
MNIQDKVILITGSSSGIGKTAAIRLAAKGAKVVVNYRENKKGGEDTCKNIKDGRGECMLAQADITDEQQVKSMIAEIIQKWGRIDVLINNGAIPHDQVPYFESPLSEMQKLVNTDLVAPMFVS